MLLKAKNNNLDRFGPIHFALILCQFVVDERVWVRQHQSISRLILFAEINKKTPIDH